MSTHVFIYTFPEGLIIREMIFINVLINTKPPFWSFVSEQYMNRKLCLISINFETKAHTFFAFLGR
jgi:hypothetical protein